MASIKERSSHIVRSLRSAFQRRGRLQGLVDNGMGGDRDEQEALERRPVGQQPVERQFSAPLRMFVSRFRKPSRSRRKHEKLWESGGSGRAVGGSERGRRADHSDQDVSPKRTRFRLTQREKIAKLARRNARETTNKAVKVPRLRRIVGFAHYRYIVTDPSRMKASGFRRLTGLISPLIIASSIEDRVSRITGLLSNDIPPAIAEMEKKSTQPVKISKRDIESATLTLLHVSKSFPSNPRPNIERYIAECPSGRDNRARRKERKRKDDTYANNRRL